MKVCRPIGCLYNGQQFSSLCSDGYTCSGNCGYIEGNNTCFSMTRFADVCLLSASAENPVAGSGITRYGHKSGFVSCGASCECRMTDASAQSRHGICVILVSQCVHVQCSSHICSSVKCQSQVPIHGIPHTPQQCNHYTTTSRLVPPLQVLQS